MTSTTPRQRLRLIAGGIFLTLLLAAVFTLGSLDAPFQPRTWRDVLTLYAVSSFITALLMVFALILVRSTLRLWAERSREQLGARFKSKMVVGALAISLLPVLFMFFVSYSLLNRTLARWFPRPLEIAAEQSNSLLSEMGAAEHQRLAKLASTIRARVTQSSSRLDFGFAASCEASDGSWAVDARNAVTDYQFCAYDKGNPGASPPEAALAPPVFKQKLPSGAELWSANGRILLAASVPLDGGEGAIYAARQVPNDFALKLAEIQLQSAVYDQEKQHLRALKRQLLLILVFFTVLLFFALLWAGLYLAKQVTVPIEALAEGTREVSSGNFNYQVPEQSQDELGILVRSFNAMTTQLRDSRSQIDQFTRNLQQAVQELERRRQLMETVLESIPTAVLSLDTEGRILRKNSAVARIFGTSAPQAETLDSLLGPESSRVVQTLMRRSLRMGVVSREVEMVVAGRVLHAAVTVSSLGPRRANTGYVLVVDDLTELLLAQKSAAWQEVARRIAHEIKNPLTPIQLSSQRLIRHLQRRTESETVEPLDPELTRLVEESSHLIEREVGTLAALVNEFSQFVRFPSAKLEPASVNDIVRESLEVFSGRLDGIMLTSSLAEPLPTIRADAGLLRGVIVNLIDNAAEALESVPLRNIRVSTRFNSESDSVEIAVEDTGHGISPADKDKLFLPHFSTKDRGTGLGLAIASRIVSEHNGLLRVEDNSPVGSRFILELPAAEVPSVTPNA
ncbi:MAG TPA: ATP-binding protein [Candidatus Dormibacteraeota bacterium]|nr:ATP-binding protein [Candidatus Dormibacteraeota bacterium]